MNGFERKRIDCLAELSHHRSPLIFEIPFQESPSTRSSDQAKGAHTGRGFSGSQRSLEFQKRDCHLPSPRQRLSVRNAFWWKVLAGDLVKLLLDLPVD